MKYFAIGVVMGFLGAASFATAQSVYKNGVGWSMLAVHTKGGDIAMTSHLTSAECGYWAERLTPHPKSNIENYTIVSGECFQ
jgi:hypothetical protein